MKITLRTMMTMGLLAAAFLAQAATPDAPAVTRLGDGPLIDPNVDARMGSNIRVPSLIRAPSWVDKPLGKYYLYFADHRGTYIRLAYVDDILGPWKMHEAGSLQLEDSHYPTPAHPVRWRPEPEARCMRTSPLPTCTSTTRLGESSCTTVGAVRVGR